MQAVVQYLNVTSTSLLIQLISFRSNNTFYLGVVYIILFRESIYYNIL